MAGKGGDILPQATALFSDEIKIAGRVNVMQACGRSFLWLWIRHLGSKSCSFSDVVMDIAI